MKKSKTIQFREKTVAVNELSVDQVAAFLELAADNSSAVPTHALDALMGSIVPFYLVKQCVPELSEEELTQGVGPSELKPLYDAVEEVNPFFVEMAKTTLGGVSLREAVTETS